MKPSLMNQRLRVIPIGVAGAALLIALSTWQTSAVASQALATSKSCMACHGVTNKIVGPSFREVAARYQGQADAAATLADRIRKGSTGVWGPIPMPPQSAQVNAGEATALAAWILEQR